MVLENLDVFLRDPYRNFGTISVSHFLFTSHFAFFSHSIYRGECAEKNAPGLRRRSLMVLEISMYFEKTPIGIWYLFHISFSFTSPFPIFCSLFIEETALNKMRLV